MALTRVKPGGWVSGERLTHTQMNNLDNNAVSESVRLDSEITNRVAGDAAHVSALHTGARFIVTGSANAVGTTKFTLAADFASASGYTLASNIITLASTGLYHVDFNLLVDSTSTSNPTTVRVSLDSAAVAFTSAVHEISGYAIRYTASASDTVEMNFSGLINITNVATQKLYLTSSGSDTISISTSSSSFGRNRFSIHKIS